LPSGESLWLRLAPAPIEQPTAPPLPILAVRVQQEAEDRVKETEVISFAHL